MRIKVFTILGERILMPALDLKHEVNEWLIANETINVISTALTAKEDGLIYTVIYDYKG